MRWWCSGSSPGVNHWVNFIGKFGEHGIQGSASNSDYGQFFQDAVAPIAETCQNFEG